MTIPNALPLLTPNLTPSTTHPIYHDTLTWQYSMRREMQLIFPQLYLGPFHVTKSIHELREYPLTHLIIIRDPKERHWIQPLFPQEFTYQIWDVPFSHLTTTTTTSSSSSSSSSSLSSNEKSLSPLMTMLISFCDYIHELLSNPSNQIVVCCRDGIYLSPLFMLAFILNFMLKKGTPMTLDQAYEYLQSKRFCILPKEHYFPSLQVFSTYQLGSYPPHSEKKRLTTSLGSNEEANDKKKRKLNSL